MFFTTCVDVEPDQPSMQSEKGLHCLLLSQ